MMSDIFGCIHGIFVYTFAGCCSKLVKCSHFQLHHFHMLVCTYFNCEPCELSMHARYVHRANCAWNTLGNLSVSVTSLEKTLFSLLARSLSAPHLFGWPAQQNVMKWPIVLNFNITKYFIILAFVEHSRIYEASKCARALWRWLRLLRCKQWLLH